uniref:Aromatic-L-amino-acid decarboxylase n=1 Tax=Phallusia mammillata TaxID=59560 RepID=A0A6F9DBE7_9ASCI|nr:CiHDCL histidine decarboxylase-like protein [Phallusia mammillata]
MNYINGEVNNSEVNSYPHLGLQHDDFRSAAHALVDRIIDYYGTLAERQTFPNVKPGFMRTLLPGQAPEEAENWPQVFSDVEKVIMKGSTHWNSAGFLAFFPCGTSYPALLGDLLSGAANPIGFSWASSPACTELETVMMDWLAKALNLPEFYLHNGIGPGGGVIEGLASEATLMTLSSARSKAIRTQLSLHPNQTHHDIAKRLVAYSSNLSNSSVEKAGKIALVHLKLLDADKDGSLRGETLLAAIEIDKKNGKIPIYVCASLGTTACCTFDDLTEVGPICEKEGMWLHVDAAYAGSALLCPEFQYIRKGLEFTTSFNFNPHKWMMVNYDCSALWFKNSSHAVNALNVDPIYLQHEEMGSAIDYMHWQIGLGRRFRAIKIWFVLRMVGLEGLRSHVRRGVAEAKHLEGLVKKDSRYEILFPVTLGLVCFRLKIETFDEEKTNELNRKVYEAIHADRRFFITPASVGGKFFIRIATGHVNCSTAKLDECWNVIQDVTENLLGSSPHLDEYTADCSR